MFRLVLPPLLLAGPAACIAAPTFHGDDPVGLGAMHAPVHAGAGRSATSFVPIVDVERGPWIVRTTQGVPEAAATIGLGGGVKAGLALALDAGWRADDVAAFAGPGVPDRDADAALGPIVQASVAAGPVPVRLTGAVTGPCVRRATRGASSDLRRAVGLHDDGRMRVNGFARATWAGATARTGEFGVPPSSSVACAERDALRTPGTSRNPRPARAPSRAC